MKLKYKNLPIIFVSIMVVISALIWLGLSIRVVETGTAAVVKRWGEATGRILDPGMNFVTPIRDSLVRYDLRIKKDEIAANAASSDMQDVAAVIAVNYHLERGDVVSLFETIGDDDLIKDKILAPAVQEVVKASISDYKAAELLRNREDVKAEIDRRLTERLVEYMIIVDDVSIVDLSFSQEFNAAIEAKQVAEQRAEQAKYEVEEARQEMEKMKLQRENLSDSLLQKMWIEKWNGQLPEVISGDSSQMIYGLNGFTAE